MYIIQLNPNGLPTAICGAAQQRQLLIAALAAEVSDESLTGYELGAIDGKVDIAVARKLA
jgi:hypothetical protein